MVQPPLKEKVAVVTGGARGIGKATATALVARAGLSLSPLAGRGSG